MTELIEAREAARLVGLNRYTLYKLASSGQIPVYRAGRALRFDVFELRIWMKEQAANRCQFRQAIEHQQKEKSS